ncbi:unnamed protein product [Blepharisma stoltei]|uniref:Uncharacterized protein n=1 Tax=Blepharisma stoltei TaxID=1481888 RepID=A0AAU9J4Z7_9CILI|nr:unnamed protein product [Blepharisma stoltei]
MQTEGLLKIQISPEPLYKFFKSDSKASGDFEFEKILAYRDNPLLEELEELRAELEIMTEDRERVRKFNEQLLNKSRGNGELIQRLHFELLLKVNAKNEDEKIKIYKELYEVKKKLAEKEKILESMRSILGGQSKPESFVSEKKQTLHKKSASLCGNEKLLERKLGCGNKATQNGFNFSSNQRKFTSSGIRSGMKITLHSARNSPSPNRLM